MYYNSKIRRGENMKPMIKHRGGKSREIKEIIKFIPEYKGKYIEPFFGGGALYFYLEPNQAIVNDINIPLINFYRGIKNDYEKVKSELSALQLKYEEYRKDFDELKEKNRDKRVEDQNEYLYYEMRDIFNGDKESNLHPATVYYYINKTAYSGMIRYNKDGKFNVPYGRYKNFNTELISKEHHELLKNTEIYSVDYSEIFGMAREDDFIFLDPPYDCVFSDYGNAETIEGFDENMHRKLAIDFRNLNCKALMVIGKTDLTLELYNDLIVHEYEKSYAVNIRNRFKSEAMHILVSNYTL